MQHDKSQVPSGLRKEIATFARKLKRDYHALFASDPNLRKRAGQILTALLPPKPKRRGRPGIQSVTIAIRLRRQLKRQFPIERPAKIWEPIYPPGDSGVRQHERGGTGRRAPGTPEACTVEAKGKDTAERQGRSALEAGPLLVSLDYASPGILSERRNVFRVSSART